RQACERLKSSSFPSQRAWREIRVYAAHLQSLSQPWFQAFRPRENHGTEAGRCDSYAGCGAKRCARTGGSACNVRSDDPFSSRRRLGTKAWFPAFRCPPGAAGAALLMRRWNARASTSQVIQLAQCFLPLRLIPLDGVRSRRVAVEGLDILVQLGSNRGKIISGEPIQKSRVGLIG